MTAYRLLELQCDMCAAAISDSLPASKSVRPRLDLLRRRAKSEGWTSAPGRFGKAPAERLDYCPECSKAAWA